MSQFFQSRRPPRRAPRISLRGSLPATIHLENGRQISVRLHQFSITGGLLELSAYLQERTWVGLTLPVGAGVVHPTIEMMFPMRITLGYLQPFRFVSFDADERQVLEREVAELLKQSRTPAKAAHTPGRLPTRFYLDSF